MAFIGVDPWRWQYFAPVACPAGLDIPIDEASAWELYPALRWMQNKLAIAATQDLPHGPHGVMPRRFPVFSKPIFNMSGMSTGARVIRSPREYLSSLQAGHMWMPLFKGAHVSTDVALSRGQPVWWRHAAGVPMRGGTFDYWAVQAAPRPALERCLAAWIGRHLDRFSGIVNFETIGGRIIESHLSMADQWLDLYGPGWLAATVELYRSGRWRWRDDGPRAAYSLMLYGRHGRRWTIDPEFVDGVRARPGVSSIQITFDERKSPSAHAMPPGGFRLAVVNCRDLALGKRARADLKRAFIARPG